MSATMMNGLAGSNQRSVEELGGVVEGCEANSSTDTKLMAVTTIDSLTVLEKSKIKRSLLATISLNGVTS